MHAIAPRSEAIRSAPPGHPKVGHVRGSVPIGRLRFSSVINTRNGAVHQDDDEIANPSATSGKKYEVDKITDCRACRREVFECVLSIAKPLIGIQSGRGFVQDQTAAGRELTLREFSF